MYKTLNTFLNVSPKLCVELNHAAHASSTLANKREYH